MYFMVKNEYYKIGETFTQPALTANGTVGGNTYAVRSGTVYSDDKQYTTYKAFDGNSSTLWASRSMGYEWIEFYAPDMIYPTSITVTNRPNSQNSFSSGTFYGSLDGVKYFKMGDFTNDNNNPSGIWSVQIPSPRACKYIKLDVKGFKSIHTIGVIQITINGNYIEKVTQNDYNHVETTKCYIKGLA